MAKPERAMTALIVVCVLLLEARPAEAQAAGEGCPTVLWSETWEDSSWDDDWLVEGTAWEVGAPTTGGPPESSPGGSRCHEGTSCAATILGGDYPEATTSRLVRQTSFVVPPAEEQPRLRFWHWFRFSTEYSLNDHGVVEIRPVGGEWVELSPRYTSSSGAWTRPSLDLAPYAGQEVQIAFRLTSVDDAFLQPDRSSGWHVDEVAVVAGAVTFPNPEGFEGGLGDWGVERGAWEVGSPTSGPGACYAGSQCAATILGGDHPERQSSRLVSGSFPVPPAEEQPRLRFWHWFRFSTEYSLNDHGVVEIRPVGGEWVELSPRYTSSSGAWTRPSLDLALYAGQEVQIAFRLTSVDDAFLQPDRSSGWYVDEVAVVAGPCTQDVECDDGSSCTADVCGGTGLCSHERVSEGSSCDAGDGTCLDGVCVPIPPDSTANLSVLSPCRPEPACPEGTVRCDIHVFNQGPTSAPAVVVTLDLTEDLQVVSALAPLRVYGPGGTVLGSGETPLDEGQHVEWTATDVPAGGKVATWLTLSVGAAGGEKTVAAYAQALDGAPVDPNPTNDVDVLSIVPNGALCPPVDHAQLAGSSPRAGNAICPAESLFYLATFQHPGATTADVVIDLDPCLDPGTVGALMPDTGCEITADAITCTAVPLDAGGGGQVSFGVKPRLTCALGAMIEVQGTVTFDDALILETNTTSHELMSCATPTPTSTPTVGPTPTPIETPTLTPTPAPTEHVCATVGPGESVTTDSENDGATEDDPVETWVKVPAGGEVCITEQPATMLPPVGYAVLGQEIDITAPAATAGNPLMITFVLDGAWVPPGKSPFTLEIFRNGALVPGCVTSSGTANPDPCVMDRRRVEDDVAITVLTSTASLWHLAVPTLDAFACAKAKTPRGAPKLEKRLGLAATDVLQGFLPGRVDVTKPLAVCDPADETGEGRTRPATHLVAYAVKQGKVCAADGEACRRAADCGAEDACTKQTPPARTMAVVHDQLGTLAVETRKLTTLLVPSAQGLGVEPPPLELGTAGVDPFTCYAVKTLKRVCAGDPAVACRDDAACGDAGPCQVRFPKTLTVQLDDEAGAGPQVFAVKKPTLLCTPANLLPDEAASPATYLQCYQLKALKGQCANAATVNGAGCKKETDCGGIPDETSFCEAQPKPRAVAGRHLNNPVLGSVRLDTKTDRSVCLPAQAVFP